MHLINGGLNDKESQRNPRNLPEGICAGGVVVRIAQDGELFIGLIKEGNKPAWVLPKGHVEEGESYEEAACRETWEELGIKPSDLSLIKMLGVVERESHERDEWKVTRLFIFKLKEGADETGFKGKWFLLHDLPEMFWEGQKKLVISMRDKIPEMME